MQIAFASLVGVEPMPFATLVERAKGLGLDRIVVNVGPGYKPIDGAPYGGHLDLAAIVRDGPGQVREVLDRHGVEIVGLGPVINLLTADLSLRAERIAAFRLAIQACEKLGVTAITTFAGSAYGMHFYGVPGHGPEHPSNRVRDNLRIFKEVYGPLTAFAEAHGVRIGLDTAGRGGGEGNIAHNPELWDMIFEAVPSPALGLSFDPSHCVWLHIPDVPDLIRAYGSRIVMFEAKDTEILPAVLARQGILGSGWWRYRLPGLGALDWRNILSALKDIGYDGPVSIENEDPLFLGLDGVAWSANYLRGIFPMDQKTGSEPPRHQEHQEIVI